MSNSGPGAEPRPNERSESGGAWMAQRTVLDRRMYEALIDALLDGDEDQRIAAAQELTAFVPSWWSGPTRHRVRARQGDAVKA